MWSRFIVPALGVFWAIMSFLLWRSEYGHADFSGTQLPPEMVWRMILTSPDSSSLAVVYRGKRIGFCHLITSVAEQLHASSPTNLPEGLVRNIRGYQLDLSGSIDIPGDSRRFRFDGQMSLSENQAWEDFSVQLVARPLTLQADSTRSEKVIHLKIEGPDHSFKRELRLEQFQQPETVLTELFGQAAPLIAGLLPFRMPESQSIPFQENLRWQASTDRITIGRATAQIYRLELKPLENYTISLLVSRAGEILRVELPKDLTLINEALTGL